MKRPTHRKLLVIIGTIAAFVSATSGQPAPPGNKPDVTLGSTPDTVVWGYISSAKAATQTIPIVFTANGDPVRGGLVASLHRPGGNATGITIFGGAAVTKRLQLLHELTPNAGTIAYLINPNHPSNEAERLQAQSAARALGKKMPVLSAGNEGQIDTTFSAMVQQKIDALLVASDAFFFWAAQSACFAGSTPSDTRDLLFTRIRRGWWFDDLRQQPA